MQNLRDRIVTAAYPLFAARGVRDVTEEAIQEAAGVTGAELAAEFPSPTAVAAACLVERERDWTIGVVEAGARARGATPEARLLAVFDVLEEWIQSDEEDATTFLDVLIRLGHDRRLGRADIEHLSGVRDVIASLAIEAGLREPAQFALSFHVLMKGSILSALEGDTLTGVQARELGRELIARHRPTRHAAHEVTTTDGTWFSELDFELEETRTSLQQPQGAPSMIDWEDSFEFERGGSEG
ncbi:TetR/AcrR family transcriptional regulator [Naasia aerilata]|uniref:TetR family transcriptional regulator n=1 Tax=Naasia aerilata TaxID=1162966 RepID=A0ABN6XSC2_9MICO|nr:TetR family transcriptional regulator [Naasia aerilata]BDZ46500.1 TetR family transcriptional regulator [Naasia aerilata]